MTHDPTLKPIKRFANVDVTESAATDAPADPPTPEQPVAAVVVTPRTPRVPVEVAPQVPVAEAPEQPEASAVPEAVGEEPEAEEPTAEEPTAEEPTTEEPTTEEPAQAAEAAAPQAAAPVAAPVAAAEPEVPVEDVPAPVPAPAPAPAAEVSEKPVKRGRPEAEPAQVAPEAAPAPGRQTWRAPVQAALDAIQQSTGEVITAAVPIFSRLGNSVQAVEFYIGEQVLVARDLVRPEEDGLTPESAAIALRQMTAPRRWLRFGRRVPCRLEAVAWEALDPEAADSGWVLLMSSGSSLAFRQLTIHPKQ